MPRFNTQTFSRLWGLIGPFFRFKLNLLAASALTLVICYFVLIIGTEIVCFNQLWIFWTDNAPKIFLKLPWIPWLLIIALYLMALALATIPVIAFWRKYHDQLEIDIHWQAWGLLTLLVIFAISVSAISVKINYLGGDFFTALEVKDQSDFLKKLLYYLLGFAVITPVNALYRFVEERMALYWRRWLSHEILKDYYSQKAYYKVGFQEGIDNPDQRISEDVRNFTATCVSLFVIFTNAVLNLVLFIYILWSISYNLIYAVFLYSFLGSLVTYLVGRPLIQLNFAQLRKEANYRYKLVNVRDNAESISFFRGDRKELTRSRQKLKKAIENQLRIIRLNRNLNFFVHGYNNLKVVVPVIVTAPLYMNNTIKLGQIVQSQGAFLTVLDSLSIFIQHFGTISSLTAMVGRLGSFREALAEDRTDKPKAKVNEIKIQVANKIEFRDVSIVTPKRDQTLTKNLSFTLEQGGLLISGPSGSGKSSIFRAIAGLWKAGSGKVLRPDLAETVFLPQRPYMVIGTLRNQLMYAAPQHGQSDRELRGIMEQVGLESVLRRVNGLGAVKDWYSILSTGEQQRLAIARLLIAKPKFAFLDEATTAIDEAAEKVLYEVLQKTLQAFISIGYRQNLHRFHSAFLTLNSDGSWQIEKNMDSIEGTIIK